MTTDFSIRLPFEMEHTNRGRFLMGEPLKGLRRVPVNGRAGWRRPTFGVRDGFDFRVRSHGERPHRELLDGRPARNNDQICSERTVPSKLAKGRTIPVKKGNEHIRNEIVSGRGIQRNSERGGHVVYGVDDQSDVAVAETTPSRLAPRKAIAQKFTIKVGKTHSSSELKARSLKLIRFGEIRVHLRMPYIRWGDVRQQGNSVA